MKAERHLAVPLADYRLLQCENDAAQEWVTYQYRTAYPILRWLPSKLTEWIADNLGTALQVPAKNLYGPVLRRRPSGQ